MKWIALILRYRNFLYFINKCGHVRIVQKSFFFLGSDLTQEFMPSSLGVDEDDLFNLAICPEGYKGNLKKNILDTTTFNPTSELNVIVIYIYSF